MVAKNDSSNERFGFGKNWQNYSREALDSKAYEAALAHLKGLLPHTQSKDSFLDIGCGSGLFLIAANELGFKHAHGFDYDPNSVAATQRNIERFLNRRERDRIHVDQGDILDMAYIDKLSPHSLVYAWGSLHHTGHMWDAVKNAASLVAPSGVFVIAIYNKTWSAPAWRMIKRTYVKNGPWVRKLLVGASFVVGAAARAAYTRSNPFKQRRGMNFYYNIVDWVGGYPYEYASIEELKTFVEALGFDTLEVRAGATPIACNELIFHRMNQDKSG